MFLPIVDRVANTVAGSRKSHALNRLHKGQIGIAIPGYYQIASKAASAITSGWAVHTIIRYYCIGRVRQRYAELRSSHRINPRHGAIIEYEDRPIGMHSDWGQGVRKGIACRGRTGCAIEAREAALVARDHSSLKVRDQTTSIAWV
jgi:hypothetical protein